MIIETMKIIVFSLINQWRNNPVLPFLKKSCLNPLKNIQNKEVFCYPAIEIVRVIIL